MLPRLQAEAMLDHANATALGSGALRKDAAQRMARRLERQANAGAPARLDPSTAPGRATLAMIGIAVQVSGASDQVSE